MIKKYYNDYMIQKTIKTFTKTYKYIDDDIWISVKR